MNHLKIISKWVLPSVKIAFKMLAVSAEVFCRHSFGRRYLPTMLGGFFCCFAALNLFRMAVPQVFPALIDIYLLIFFVLVLYHLTQMWCQRPTIHSYSTGQSWEFWSRHNFNSNLVSTLVEPLLNVLVGLLLMPANVLLSVWLQLAGGCLFIKELLAYWQFRNRVLDSMDARLEGERIGTGVRQQTAPQRGREPRVAPVVTAGPTLPSANSIQQIYSRLDPALQQLVATPNQNPPHRPTPNRPVNPLVVIRRQGRMPATRPGMATPPVPPIPQPQAHNVPPLLRRPNPSSPQNRTQ
jgi:hypothetical protein